MEHPLYGRRPERTALGRATGNRRRCETFGRPTEPLPFDENDENADLRVAEDETTNEVLAFSARARTASDRVIRELDLDIVRELIDNMVGDHCPE